jgi:phosphate transport system protein
MRASLDRQLAEMKSQVLTLGALAIEQLSQTLAAMEQRDAALAHRVAGADMALDEAESAIDGLVLRVMALQQPEAVDLRALLAGLRIATALERIGDHAKTVAKRLPAIVSRLGGPVDPDLVALGRMALRELDDAVRAYGTDDAALALDLCARDVELDRLYTAYVERVMTAMEAGRTAVRCGVFQLYSARNFERIGDQATNIAERVHFVVRGALPAEERPRIAGAA